MHESITSDVVEKPRVTATLYHGVALGAQASRMVNKERTTPFRGTLTLCWQEVHSSDSQARSILVNIRRSACSCIKNTDLSSGSRPRNAIWRIRKRPRSLMRLNSGYSRSVHQQSPQLLPSSTRSKSDTHLDTSPNGHQPQDPTVSPTLTWDTMPRDAVRYPCFTTQTPLSKSNGKLMVPHPRSRTTWKSL